MGPRLRVVALCLVVTAIVFGPVAYGVIGAGALTVALLGCALATALGLAIRLPLDAAVVVAPIAGVLAGLLALPLLPIALGPGVTFALLLTLAAGILDGMAATRAAGLREGLRLSAGLAIWLALGLLPAYGWKILVGVAIVTPMVGAFAGLEWPTRGGARRWLWPPLALVLTTAAMGITAATATLSPVSTALGFTGAAGMLFVLGRLIAGWLSPRVRVLTDLALYLRAMWVPLGGFVVGYLFLALFFAGLYAALNRAFPATSFVGVSDPSFGDWFFFSVTTATTLGDPVVQPVSGFSRSLVGIQAVLATCWLIAVFAAVTAHLQPAFARIAARGADRDSAS
jgi:hypothetical protein